MKTFIAHSFPKLKRVDSDGGRTYETPTGNCYPSVTSVVGLHKAKFIQEWRARVGEQAANKISSKASKRGTAIHSLCEDYLLGNELNVNPFDHEMFTSLKPHLDKIDNIHCLETQLYSHHLQVAGTVDVICEFGGDLTVLDFKTSSRVKTHHDIHDYFMQCAAYSFMFWEMSGILIPKITIVMGVDDNEALVFQEPVTPWLKKFQIIREAFKRIKEV